MKTVNETPVKFFSRYFPPIIQLICSVLIFFWEFVHAVINCAMQETVEFYLIF